MCGVTGENVGSEQQSSDFSREFLSFISSVIFFHFPPPNPIFPRTPPLPFVTEPCLLDETKQSAIDPIACDLETIGRKKTTTTQV